MIADVFPTAFGIGFSGFQREVDRPGKDRSFIRCRIAFLPLEVDSYGTASAEEALRFKREGAVLFQLHHQASVPKAQHKTHPV